MSDRLAGWRQRQHERWEEERLARMRLWEKTEDHRIENLARNGGTPLNDYFSAGKGVWGLADFVAALERRVARLEDL